MGEAAQARPGCGGWAGGWEGRGLPATKGRLLLETVAEVLAD